MYQMSLGVRVAKDDADASFWRRKGAVLGTQNSVGEEVAKRPGEDVQGEAREMEVDGVA